MFDWLWLLLGTVRVLLHDRHALLVENLLLRARPRPRLRRRDRLFWAVACRVCAEWRRHLVLVRLETVLRWHRRGWRLGIDTLLTPFRSPRANAVAGRVIGTLRRECLDHLIPVDERHLRTVLAEYVDYYNGDRPHRTLQLEPPRP